MRTTLTLDDDVAAAIDQLRRARGGNFKDLINDALRLGLCEISAAAKPREPFRTRSVDLGRVLIGDIDSVADALAAAEGEAFR
jgi:hypothetical protein